jgi:hypothetical protein
MTICEVQLLFNEQLELEDATHKELIQIQKHCVRME